MSDESPVLKYIFICVKVHFFEIILYNILYFLCIRNIINIIKLLRIISKLLQATFKLLRI